MNSDGDGDGDLQRSSVVTVLDTNPHKDPHNYPQKDPDAAPHLSNNADDEVDVDGVDAVASADISTGPNIQTTNLEFVLILTGLAMAVFLASLDQTIVSVTIPAVAKEFKSLDQISWIGTAFFLTSTALIPSFGKLADIFGRKPTFLAAILIFEIGSLLCGVATSMTFLIVGRAVAGMGGGGIFSLAIVIISDLVALRDRAKYQGLIGACFGLASVAGPLLGGVFTDTLSWRWCFYINLPLGAVSVFVCMFVLRLPPSKQSWRESLSRVDVAGTVLLICAVVALLIPIQGGGVIYPWSSPTVISLFVVGGVLTMVFVYVEAYHAKEPIMPFELFRHRHALPVFATSFFLGLSFFPLVFYSPVYFQISNGQTATQAGVSTIPLIMGMVVFSIATGFIASSTGYYMPLITLGGVMTAIGAGLMSTLNSDTLESAKIGYLILAGMGIGTCFQSIIIAAQAAVDESYLSVVTSITNFWQTIGAVIGVAITSSIFNNKLVDGLSALASSSFNPMPLTLDPSLIRNPDIVPTIELQRAVVSVFEKSIGWIFLCVVPFAGALVIASLFVKRQKMTTGQSHLPAMA